VERNFADGKPGNLFPAYDAFLAREPVPWGNYNLIRPEPVQRNQTVNLDTIGRLAGVEALEEIPVYGSRVRRPLTARPRQHLPT
jgi:hypothetical protein